MIMPARAPTAESFAGCPRVSSVTATHSMICACRTPASRTHDHYPGTSRSSHFCTRPVYQASINRQIHAGRVAATIVGLRRVNIRRDYSQADRVDLLVQVVAYRDHPGDGQRSEIVISDFHIYRQDLFHFVGVSKCSCPRKLRGL